MLTPEQKQKLKTAGYSDSQISAFEAKKFGKTAPQSSLVPGTSEHTTYNGLMRGSLSHDEEVADEPYDVGGVKYNVGGFLGNTLKSGGRLLGGVAEAVLNPIDTVTNIGKLGVGGVQALLGTGEGTETRQMADSLGQFYKQRYGGAQNIKDTLYQDPIGVLADLSTVLGLGGAAFGLASKAGTVGTAAGAAKTAAQAGSTAGRIGSALSKASTVTDPLMLGAGAVGKVAPKAVGLFDDTLKATFSRKQKQLATGLEAIYDAESNPRTAKAVENIDPFRNKSQAELEAMKPEEMTKAWARQAQKMGEAEDVIKASKESDRVPTIQRKLADTGTEAYSKLEALRESTGKALGEELKTVGATPVDATSLFDDISKSLEEKIGYTLEDAGSMFGPHTKVKGDVKMPKTITLKPIEGGRVTAAQAKSIEKILNESLSELGDTPTLKAVDNAINKIRMATKLDETQIGAFVGDVEDMLRSKAREAAGGETSQYARLKDKYSDIEDVIGKSSSLKNTATADKYILGILKENSAEAQTIADDLDRIQNLTGVDLYGDAHIAQMALERFGDSQALKAFYKVIESVPPAALTSFGKVRLTSSALNLLEGVGIDWLGKTKWKSVEDVISRAGKEGIEVSEEAASALKKATDSVPGFQKKIVELGKKGDEAINEWINTFENKNTKKVIQAAYNTLKTIEKNPTAASRQETALEEEGFDNSAIPGL